MGDELKKDCADAVGKHSTKSSSPPRGMILTFKRVQVDKDPAVSSEFVSTPNGDCSTRLVKMQADCGSDDEQNLFRALRHRPWISYHEWETSSEDESDSEQINNGARSSALPVGVVRGCSYCEDCQKVLARWRPEAGCRPSLEEAPVFFPLEEEFRDTLKYIASISAEAERYGICRIVPPHSWRPPCPLKDSKKRQTTKFPTRVQQLDKLQVREVQSQTYSHVRKRRRGRPSRRDAYMGRRSLHFEESGNDATCVSANEEGKFGFEPGPKVTLEKFEKYANQFKEEYFRIKEQTDVCNDSKMKHEPSIESIEGEYWRIVEHATEQIEVLYGADVETREFGSGFPKATSEAEPNLYESSGWNLNNIARLSGSVLSFEEGEISGVVVPWLYVGMCFSSFCWHVEDHHFYSLNYMHFGSPKVWYGVPGSAAHKLEDAMKKHLPELFKEQPDLLHKLVTQLSPSVLKAAGVPVYRAVQKAGEFVVTFPRAYHAGFNCGFNCAEAVNVAPLDWLPHGQSAIELYREQGRRSTVSHDKLLLGAAKQAVKTQHQFAGVNADAKDDVHISAWQESVGPDEILTNVLKDRVNVEHTRRSAIDNVIQARRMDRSFDAVHERECAICHYDLHLSAIGCDCAPERFTCLEHAHQLCSCEEMRKFALYRYNLSELDTLVTALEGQSDAVSRWLNIEQQLSMTASSFAGLELSRHSHNKLNSSLCNTRKVSENSRVGLNFTSHEDKKMSESAKRVAPLLYQDNPQSSGLMLPDSAWSAHEKGRKKLKGMVDNLMLQRSLSFNLRNHEQNVEGFTKAETLAFEAKQTQEEITLPVVPGCSRTEGCEPLLHPFTVQPQIKKGVEIIVLSDDEDDVARGSFSNSSHAVEFMRETAGQFDKLGNCSIVNEAAPMLREDNNIAPKDCELQAFGHDRSIADLKVRWQDPSNETALHLPPNFFTPPVENGANKMGYGGTNMDWLFKRHVKPSLSQLAGRFPILGMGSSEQVRGEPPARCLPSFENSKLHEGHGFVGVLEHNFPSAVGRVEENSGCSFYGHSSLGGPEESGCKVDLLSIGRLVLQKSWYNKDAIFPAGFRSRVLFPSILDPFHSCFYISEVLDSGYAEPLFKVVMENHPSEVFIDPSIDRCWQMVQERINMTIHLRHDLGNMRFSFLHKHNDLRGIELFGFTSPHIRRAVELLDWRHQCIEYWAGRLSAIELLENQHQVQVSHGNGADCTERTHSFREPFMMVPLHSSHKVLETASLRFNPMQARHNV